MEEIIKRMQTRIMEHQKENGFETVFDFLNEDLSELEQQLKNCNLQNVMASYSIEQNLNIFDIANMSIKQSENGFSVWMLEPCEDGELRKRWIVDASNVLKDARIELSNKEGREFRSVYVADENCIEIQRR